MDSETNVPTADPPETAHSIVPEGSVARKAAAPLRDEVVDVETETAEKTKGPEVELDRLRQDMGITDTVDPMQALLASPIGIQEGIWHSRRLNTDFKVRSLDNESYAKAQEQSTRFTRNRRTGRMEKDIDGTTLSFLVVAAGCIEPNFNDQRLLQKYHAIGVQDAVKKALLPGEIDQLAEKILQLSGFDEDLEDQGKD